MRLQCCFLLVYLMGIIDRILKPLRCIFTSLKYIKMLLSDNYKRFVLAYRDIKDLYKA